MNLNRFCFILLFFLAVTSVAFSQEQILTGRVIDKESGEPVRNTEIFISGTTVGCTTDALGQFTLKLPYLPCILIANHVAYEAYVKPIDSANSLTIELQASVYQIRGVNVAGKDRRKRNLRFFYAHFIQENQRDIEILNDSVLVFERDDMSFNAYCNEPLLIENDFLGYRIKVIIEEFNVTVRNGPNGEQLPLNSARGGELTNLEGYFYYEPLENTTTVDKADSYENNRRVAYYGSYRHFLKALYDADFSDQGFVLENFPNDSISFCEIKGDEDLSDAKRYLMNADSLKVCYYYDDHKKPVPINYIANQNYVFRKISMIYPTKQPFVVRENGTSPKLTFIIRGSMMIKNFANSLPEDYLPE